MKRTTLFLTLLALVGYTIALSEAGYVTDGLISYWTFDDATIEGDTVKDIAGNNDGTMIGNVKVVEGKTGQAVEFDGLNGRIDCGNDDSLKPTDGVTVEAWVKIHSYSANYWRQTVAGSEDSSRGYVLRGLGADTTSELAAGNGNLWHDQANAKGSYKDGFDFGTWYHIVGTVEADGESKVYINAEQCNVGLKFSGKLAPSNRAFAIGSLAQYPDRTFPGVIDEVRIYNRALTQDEIQNNFSSVGAAVSPASKIALTWGGMKSLTR